MTRIEILYAGDGGGPINGTAAQLQSFTTIAYDADHLGETVELGLLQAGTVDLTAQLLGRAVRFAGSVGDDNIATSNGDDTIFGNGANRIDGGLGSDRLTGKDGADTFAFTTAPSGTNIDTITDFTIGSDVVLLAKSIYSALAGGATPGSLSPNAFRTSTQASTSGGLGEIIYNATTGSLLYDADGSGAGVAKQFATLSTGLALSAASFKLA